MTAVGSDSPRGRAGRNDDGNVCKLLLLCCVGADGRVSNFVLLQRGSEHSVAASRRLRQHVWIHGRSARRTPSKMVSQFFLLFLLVGGTQSATAD